MVLLINKSDGNSEEITRHVDYESAENKFYDKCSQLAKLQRQLAHKQKYSKNYYKKKRKIASLHEKISNIRNNNLHQISHKIVSENQVIVSENLKIKNMLKPSFSKKYI